MRMAQGITGWPVSLAHSALTAQTRASSAAAVSRLTKKTRPTSISRMRTAQRVRVATKSFKAKPFLAGPVRQAGSAASNRDKDRKSVVKGKRVDLGGRR